MPHPTCAHEGCDGPVLNRKAGLCQRHYFQYRMANRKPCAGCGKPRLCGEDGRCRGCVTAALRVCPDCGGRKKVASALCVPCFARSRAEADIQGILLSLARGVGGSETARRFRVSPAHVSDLKRKHAKDIERLARMVGAEPYGFLRVVSRSERRSPGGHLYWLCECDLALGGCGSRTEVVGVDLTRGRTRSCGCGQGRSSDGK